MNKKKSIIIAACSIAVIAIVVIIILIASGKKGYRSVKVNDTEGSVSVTREKGDAMEAIEGMKLESGDTVNVDAASSIILLVDDDKHIAANENTKFAVVATGSANKGNVKIDLLEGTALFTIDNKLPNDSTFEVDTPNATFSVRGTKFVVTYDSKNNLTTLEVMEGTVHTTYESGIDEEDVEAGENRVITVDDRYTGDIEDALAEILGTIGDDNNIGTPDDTGDVTGTGTDVGSSGYDLPSADNDPYSIYAAYAELVKNMRAFIDGCDSLKNDYSAYDYMYIDYNGDGIKEIVFYLRFSGADGATLRDVVFMDYFEDEGKIGIRGINYNEDEDHSFYVEYNGKLGRYSWNVSARESYLYLVEARDNTIMYVLEKGYDEVLADFESEGMYAIPLHGDWELLLED